MVTILADGVNNAIVVRTGRPVVLGPGAVPHVELVAFNHDEDVIDVSLVKRPDPTRVEHRLPLVAAGPVNAVTAGGMTNSKRLLWPHTVVPEMQEATLVAGNRRMQHHLVVELPFFPRAQNRATTVLAFPLFAVVAGGVADRVAAGSVAGGVPHVELAAETQDGGMVDFRGVERAGLTVFEDRIAVVLLFPADAVFAGRQANGPGKAIIGAAVVPHPPRLSDVKNARVLGLRGIKLSLATDIEHNVVRFLEHAVRSFRVRCRTKDGS